MATIIIITPPKKPPVHPQGGPYPTGGPMDAFSFEVPNDLSTADALRYIADQLPEWG